ncbi:phage tail protein [Planomicrobium okeanokoites]|uniref:phage tail protein n=1 Tax=Planomicrobium okeanokoites TaxID=244 RepID=UPI000A0441B7|nr:hypothetical protein [Planomicrobium okeanokoites]
MANNFEAIIGAEIQEFQRKMAEVDERIRTAASGADAEIGADITEFMSEIRAVQAAAEEIARNNTDAQIGADITEFLREMALVEAQLAQLAREHDIDIDVDTGEAQSGLLALWASIQALTGSKFVVKIRTNWTNYQNTMGSIANFSRSIGEIMQMTTRGIMISLSPALVPLIASLIGLIGNLGPMVGTLGGSTFALATAMGAAGLGIAGFAAVAVPVIGDLFKMDEAIGRNTAEWNKLSETTRNALNAIDEFQGNWGKFQEDMRKPITSAFTTFMQTANSLLNLFKPAIEGSVTAVGNLMKSLQEATGGAQVKGFFEWLGTSAGPHIETLGKAIGNLVVGFMNMMVAFGPLAETTAAGFQKMTEGFAAWAAGLSESKKFQQFVDYVNENMPKIRAIFRDAIAGIVYLFAGFGASSSDMMTKLQGMMGSFKTWASELKSNTGFQSFLGYIRESAPRVVDLIANLTKFIVNLGIALAPIGLKVMDVANKIFEWMNSMMQSHAWIGKVLAMTLIFGGALLALAPNIVALVTLFSGFGTAIMGGLGTAFRFIKPLFTDFGATMTRIGTYVSGFATRILPLLARGLAVLTGPVGIAIAILSLLIPVFVRLWRENEAFRESVKNAWSIIQNIFSTTVSFISNIVMSVIGSLVSWWQQNQGTFSATAQKVWDTIYTAVVAVLSGLWSIIKQITSKIQEVWSNHGAEITAVAKFFWSTLVELTSRFISIIFGAIKLGLGLIQGIFQAVWPQISGVVQIAWALIQTIAEVGINLLYGLINAGMSLLKGDWEGAWQSVKETASSIMDSIVNTFADIDLWQIGKDIIQGLINGISSMASAAWDAVKGLASNLVGAARKELDTHSPSRVFESIGGDTVMGLVVGIGNRASRAVDSVRSVAADMTRAFNPQLAMADMRASARLDTSISRADMGVVRHAFAAEMDSLEIEQEDLVLMVDGRELGKVVARSVQEENDDYADLVAIERGGL